MPAPALSPEELQKALQAAQEELNQDKNVQKKRCDRLKVLLQRTPTCSGSCRVELRSFIEAVDAAKRYSDAGDAEVLPQLISLCTDPLRSSIDQFIRENAAATWDEIKTYIIKQFLESDESSYLTKLVDNTRQAFTEDIRAYALRFTERVRRAYKPDELKIQFLQKDLTKRFIQGIESQQLRQELWKGEPTDLGETASLACKLARAFELAAPSTFPGVGGYSTNQEEEMDISAASSVLPDKEFEQALKRNVSFKPQSAPHPRPRARSESTERGATRPFHQPQRTSSFDQHQRARSFDQPQRTSSFDQHQRARSFEQPQRQPPPIRGRASTRGARGATRGATRGARGPPMATTSRIYAAQPSTSQISCHYCGIIGHKIRDCRKKRMDDGVCVLCAKPGHFARNCNQARGQFSYRARPRTYEQKQAQNFAREWTRDRHT